MALLVSDLILLIRTGFNDELSDHFAKDDITSQVDGTSTRFRFLNRNIVDTTDGAPVSPQVFLNNAAQTITLTKQTGVFTLATAPATGNSLTGEYYFTLLTDSEYLSIIRNAERFVGTTPLISATNSPLDIADGLVESARLYGVAEAAKKMANLSGWYYQANAGNKSFNKAQVSSNFLNISKENFKEANQLRDDVYKRFSQREAPAFAFTNIGPLANQTTPPRR